MTSMTMLFVDLRQVWLLTAKREDDKAIGQAFEALLAKKDWSELEALSHAAKSYHPTEVVEGEIASPAGRQGEKTMKKVLVTGATGFRQICCGRTG